MWMTNSDVLLVTLKTKKQCTSGEPLTRKPRQRYDEADCDFLPDRLGCNMNLAECLSETTRETLFAQDAVLVQETLAFFSQVEWVEINLQEVDNPHRSMLINA